MPAQPREHTRTYFLGKLAEELEQRGLTVTLRSHPPALRINDPDTVLLAETVDCVPLSEGWFYRWSWGELVGLTDDPALAAERIVHVLAARQ
ncbi:hypothetical protein FE391_38065 [Nonomuraea sp. KC401]|uniref:hypothetical protein n=1 Tax=unclassified Nonomuraea TaxID=2593643 RepID=UPI0010FF34CD|nr:MULTISPECIES: hypothetical protein [unclassified Nonomuraea]NBE99434.1 hypothetical protein [Nonomuraea sp. K271]TLF57354.1 hypothetical protein FE391_38065 [Nonomuraea sp. KC401]